MTTNATTKSQEAKKSASRKRPARQLDKFKFDALPDRIDLRDWFYQPNLEALPATLVNCDRVPKILDQGEDGACTGFALAAVINFQLQAQNLKRLVSPWMLYEMARRYDEWPGVKYEGSSARGAMKGWVTLGVCEYLHRSKTDRRPTPSCQKRPPARPQPRRSAPRLPSPTSCHIILNRPNHS